MSHRVMFAFVRRVVTLPCLEFTFLLLSFVAQGLALHQFSVCLFDRGVIEVGGHCCYGVSNVVQYIFNLVHVVRLQHAR